MLLRLLSLLAILFFPSPSVAQTPSLEGSTASLWDHNGSVVRMFRWPDGRIMIAYDKPRDGFADLTPRGTIFFVGSARGGAVRGKAGDFKQGCKHAEFAVEGRFEGDGLGKLVLRGKQPVRRGCRVTGYERRGDALVLSRLTDAPAQPAVSKPTPLAQRSHPDLKPLVDEITGMKIGVPADMPGTIGRGEHGPNWKSADGNLSIDLLRFPTDRSLRSIYEKLKAISARQITRDEYSEQGFALEGIDANRARFIVKIEQRDGEKRGLSVVYSSEGGANLTAIAHRIAGTMQAFAPAATGKPAAVVARGATGPTGVDASAAGSCKDGLRWRAVSGGSGQGLAQLESCGAQSPVLPIQFRCATGSDRVKVTVPMVQTLPRSVRGPFPVSLYAQGADTQTPDGARIPDQTRLFQAVRQDGPGAGTLAFEIAESDPLLKALAIADTGYVSIIARSLGFHLEGAGQALSEMRAACGLEIPSTAGQQPVETAADEGSRPLVRVETSDAPQLVGLSFDPAHAVVARKQYRNTSLQGRNTDSDPICRSAHVSVRNALRAIKVTLPSQVVEGEAIALDWDTSTARLPSDHEVFLLFELPEQTIHTGNHEAHAEIAWVVNAAPKGRQQRWVQLSGKVHNSSVSASQSRGRILIQPTSVGGLTVSATIVIARKWSGEWAGDKLVCEGKVIAGLEQTVTVRPADWPKTESTGCHLSTTSKPSVELTLSDRSVSFGGTASLNWRVNGKLDPACIAPLYLMLSMPKRSRFEGDGFVALAPSAKGPFGIAHALDTARVFAPLNIGDVGLTGTINIKPYQVGDFPIRVQLVEVPTYRDIPASPRDYHGAASIAVALQPETFHLRVEPGVARVVVQSRDVILKPTNSVFSNSGEFVLQEFEGFYRVVDQVTGELLVQRDGTSPRFSATSRFVVALLENASGLEVFDLYASRATETFRSAEENIHSRAIDHVAWGAGDSFLLYSATAQVGAFSQALIDGRSLPIDPGAYKRATVTGLMVSASLESLSLFTQRGESASPDGLIRSLLGRSADAQLSSDDLSFERAYNLASFSLPRFDRARLRWALPGSTHYLPFDVKRPEALEPRLAHARREWRRAVRQNDSTLIRNSNNAGGYIVHHASLASWQREITLNYQEEMAFFTQLPPLMIRHGAGRSEPQRLAVKGSRMRIADSLSAVRASSSAAGLRAESTVFKTVAGINFPVPMPGVASAKAPENWSKNWEASLNDWERVPSDPDCAERQIMQLASVWVIHRRCLGGSGWYADALMAYVVNARGRKLFSLRFKEDGLDSGKLARSWLSEDGVLMVAMPNRAIVLFDTKTGEKMPALKQLDGTEIPAELRISEDRSKLLQINEDGRVIIFDVATGKRLLSGFTFDDELVLYTDNGHYAATSEGAHFVSLKFPGVPGTYTFHQFEKKLKIPNLVERVLGGETIPRVDVAVPPSLVVDFDRTADPARIRGQLGKGPFGDIAKVQFYQDGVLTDTISDIVSDGPTPFDVARLPGTRWVSLLAFDAEGLASQPVGSDLGPDPRGKARLISLAIGISDYQDDQKLHDLYGAADDARTIDETLRKLRPERPSDEARVLVDGQATRAAVLREIEAAVAKARAGDTLLLSFAGHGVKGEDGAYYLTTHDTRYADLANTGIAWGEVSGLLRRSKARIILLLDACHSGAAGTDFFATNDAAADELLAGVPSNIVIFAASKGREFSYATADGKNGEFTRAFSDVILGERATHDLNGNGVIEISELFVGVKRKVVVDGKSTRAAEAKRAGLDIAGTQTPWIARNQMVGDFALF